MSEPIPFLRPRLKGARFQGGAIPLEVLKDLSVLEEMIVEVAKWAYLQDHPNRKRSPRRFASGVSLRITGVEEGSAIPTICLYLATAALFPEPNQVYLEEARDRIVAAVDAAEHNEPITPHLPDALLGYFDRVGRSLQDGELIEFTPENEDHPARLNKTTRRKLILASARIQELTEEVTLRGSVPEADQEKMSFTVQTINGNRVQAPIDSQHLETVLEAFNGYTAGARITLSGIARFNRSNRLLSIESVEHLTLLDSNDVPARLDEFRILKDGWLDGDGSSLSADGLDWLAGAFEVSYPDDLPLPYLYPTAEGGVQAEWSNGRTEVSLEISLDTHAGEWHLLNLETDQEEEAQLDLDVPQSWEWVAEQIARLPVEEGA